METFAQIFPDRDPRECLAALHELEDEDVRSGVYTAFSGASEVLGALPSGAWALVTPNYEHRVRGRFARTGLPVRMSSWMPPPSRKASPHPSRISWLPSGSVPSRRTVW